MKKSFSNELDKSVKIAVKYKPLLIELCEIFNENGKEVTIGLSTFASSYKVSNILMTHIVEDGWLERISRGKYRVVKAENFEDLLKNPVKVFWILNTYYDRKKKTAILEASPKPFTFSWLVGLIKSLFNGK